MIARGDKGPQVLDGKSAEATLRLMPGSAQVPAKAKIGCPLSLLPHFRTLLVLFTFDTLILSMNTSVC